MISQSPLAHDGHTSDPPDDPDVLIVGAGPVGLSLALALGKTGTVVRVLDRRTGPTDQPRAHVVNARTMELFREWGVAEGIRADGLDPSLATSFAWVTSVAADEFATLDSVDDATAEWCSPEFLCSCPQDLVERRLRAAAEATGNVHLDGGHEVIGYRQVDHDRGEVEVRGPDGRTTRHQARYVVAADGASSPLRRMAGVVMERSMSLGRMLNINFHADLPPFTRFRSHVLWFVHNPATQGTLITLDGQNRWVYAIDLPASETADDYDDERCAAIVRAAVGTDDLKIDVRARLAWTMDMGVAERFRTGPLFFVGDAAHRFPPHGGFGMNSGIQDAHNLAWKLNLALRGLADDALLDTYDAERRPVAVLNATQSMENARVQQEAQMFLNAPETLALLGSPEGTELRAGIEASVAQTAPQFHSLGQQFGHVYSGAAVVDDGSPARDSTIADYQRTARPGARAPHVRLDSAGDGPTGLSTVDLVAGGWHVLVAGDAVLWRTTAPQEPALQVHGVHPAATSRADPSADLVDATEPGHFAAVYELEEGGAVLVRPDGHVLARWTQPPVDAATELLAALDAVLSANRPREST